MKQKKDDDIWLLNVGGMVPNEEEYASFLKTALELPMVSYIFFPGPIVGPTQGPAGLSGPLSGPMGPTAPYFYFEPVLIC